MNYMSDPERKRIALEKMAETRAELGPRLRASKHTRPVVLPPSTGGVRRRGGAVGNSHPTRDSPDG